MTRFFSYGAPGVGSCSMVAQDLRRAVRMWRLLQSRRNPDIRELAFWHSECVLVAGRLLSGRYYPAADGELQ